MSNLGMKDYARLLSALVEMEGENPCTCKGNSLSDAALKWKDRGEDSGENDWLATIYGFGGVRRYYLREDGLFYFSENHASIEGIAKAKSLGFVMN